MTRWNYYPTDRQARRGNKYHSEKVTVDGETFDSRKEARRWQELRLLHKAGQISELRRQVKFVLIPTQRAVDTRGPKGGVIKGKVLEREVSYLADFYYIEDGKQVVEDVKGYKGGEAYKVFVIKRKLMRFVYGIGIREI